LKIKGKELENEKYGFLRKLSALKTNNENMKKNFHKLLFNIKKISNESAHKQSRVFLSKFIINYQVLSEKTDESADKHEIRPSKQ